jgi:hypothetical protein
MLLIEMARADAMTATKAMEQRMTTFRWTTPAYRFHFNDNFSFIYYCSTYFWVEDGSVNVVREHGRSGQNARIRGRHDGCAHCTQADE